MHAIGLWGRDQQSPGDVVARLTAMQSQEHAYARWSVGQRMAGEARGADVDRAFDDGELLRTHVLRPTWHYVAPHDLRWLMALSGPRVLARNARRFGELELDARTLARANDVIAGAVATKPRTRKELAAILERKRISVEGQRLPHILMRAELTAAICSGPMRGNQHTYAAFDERVPPGADIPEDHALAELARRYFATRGPATIVDFVWWSGLSTADARRGLELAKPHLSSSVVDDRTYWFGAATVGRAGHRVDLVQCYDEVIISYSQSRALLQTPSVTFPVPRHIDGFTHVVLVDGHLAGHWRPRSGSAGFEVETRLDRALDEAEARSLHTAMRRYVRFSEGPHIMRTPLA
jgi:hypothetical protein